MYKQLYSLFSGFSNTQNINDVDTLVICGIQDSSDEKNKAILLSLLSDAISHDMNILISAVSSVELSEVCQSMWSIIDSSFIPVKV